MDTIPLGQFVGPPEPVPSPDAMRVMSHFKLRQLRDRMGHPESQVAVAPYEHRAFARENVAENPLNAVPMSFLTPGYQALKMLGKGGARTPPSWEQLMQGYTGIGEGLSQWWNQPNSP